MSGNVQKYISEFGEKVDALIELPLKEIAKPEVLIEQVEQMLEEFYTTVGRYPNGSVLSKLGTYILSADLRDKSVDKVTNTEFPILSEAQIRRRNRKQVSVEDQTLDFLEVKYNKQLDSLARVSTENGVEQ